MQNLVYIAGNSNFKVNAHILNFVDINQRLSGRERWKWREGGERTDREGKGWKVANDAQEGMVEKDRRGSE